MKAALLAIVLLLAPGSRALLGEDSASLEGVIVARGTGLPVLRARAILSRISSTDPKEALSAMTDEAGKFRINDIPPGAYRLFVGNFAYVPAEYGQLGANEPGPPMIIMAGQSLSIRMELTPTASLQGRVINESGAAVPNYLVKAFRARYERGDRVLTGGEYAVTEVNGGFRLFGLAPGWYFISASPPQEYGPLPLNETVFSWPVYYGGATEDDATPVHLDPGSVFDAGTLVALQGPVVHVQGQVINARTGKPEPDARILLGRKRRAGVETSGLSAVTLKNGFFELAGAAPGSYVIEAVTPSLAGSASFEVHGANIDSLRVLLYPRVNVSGRVRAGGGAPLAAARDIHVTLEGGRTVVESPLDSRGSFTLRNVPAGDYRLSLYGAPAGTYIKSAQLGRVNVLEKGIHVDEKLDGSLDITIGSSAGAFAPIALDAERRPVPGAIVVLVPKARNRLDLYRSAVTNASGDTRFEAVPPGEYRVFCWEEIEKDAWQDPDILRAYEPSGATVMLGESGVVIATVTVNRIWPAPQPAPAPARESEQKP